MILKRLVVVTHYLLFLSSH